VKLSILARLLVACGSILLSASVTGQPAATNNVPQPLGEMLEVGGHKMHIYCTGQGGPAVILEAGAGAFSLDWNLVQTPVSQVYQGVQL
jgi:hypothetical protein